MVREEREKGGGLNKRREREGKYGLGKREEKRGRRGREGGGGGHCFVSET